MDHNLDISTYSFRELLNLFELDPHHVSPEALKHAKKKVLRMHPDKSKLPPEYFLFYKKAFSVIVHMYENTIKTSQEVPMDRDMEYIPEKAIPEISTKQIRKTIEKIDTTQFQTQFNRLFEEHHATQIDPERNRWFQEEDPMYEEVSRVQTVGQMGDALNSIKQRSHQMIVHRDIQPLSSTQGSISGGRGNFYDHEKEDEDTMGDYITSDPFSKLKFDDLRKVHKDQTVFSVNERDIDKVPRYNSVDAYQRARGNGYVPMESSEANQLLESQERMYQEKMRQKQYQSQLRTMESEQKNKTVLSNFLRIQS